MADQAHPIRERASVRLARVLGLPEPAPWTEEQQAAYRRWMDDGDAQLDAVIARRQRAA